jgi:hypothetical protein
VSGGTSPYTYAWSPSGGTAATASSLTAGTYSCTITDANSCTFTQTFNITEPSALSVTTSQTDVTCNGGNNGSATVSVTGGTSPYTYAWAPSGGTAATASSLTAGTYSCTITDANSCVFTQTFAITEPSAVTVVANASATTICAGTSVTLTGSGTATSYSWSGGISDGVPFIPVSTMSYTVTGTDINGCSNIDSVTVNVNPLPSVTANASATTVCAGTMITLTGIGTATSYSWSGGVTDGVAFAASSSQSYTVTGTDANGCSAMDSVAITVNALPVVNLGPDQALCSGTVTLDAQNSGSTYLWSDASTSQTLLVTASGTYDVMVTLVMIRCNAVEQLYSMRRILARPICGATHPATRR